MTSDSKKELGVGIFFLALSVAYMLGTTRISTFTPFGNRGLDSRSVPQLIGFLVFVLSSVHVIQVLIQVKKSKQDSVEPLEGNRDQVCDTDEVICIEPPKGSIIARIDTVVPVKLLLSLLYLVIYVAAYQGVGFVISSTFFLLAESFLLVKKEERKRWTVFIILYSIGASALIYFIFTKYLSRVTKNLHLRNIV